MTRWLIGALLVCPLWAQPQSTYQVSGKVINSITEAPIARVRISISPNETREPEKSQVTGDDGRFAFDNLAAGKYHLAADRSGWPQQVYGQWLGAGFGTSIVTGPGQETSDLTFRLSPPAVITGHVLDDSGEPVRNALVQLLSSRILGGHRRVVTREWRRTWDVGEFRFSKLPAGSYYLLVTGRPWYVDQFRLSPAIQETAYSPVYYPSTANPGAAEALQVKAGDEIVADLRLTPIKGANINVTLGSSGNREAQIQLVFHGILGTTSLQAQEQASGNFHVFRGVPPGHYIIRAVQIDRDSSASVSPEFEVSGNDINVELSARITSAISGTVELPGKEIKSLAGGLISLVDEESVGFSLEITPKGTFAASPALPGRYRVRFFGIKDVNVAGVSGEAVDKEGWVTIGEAKSANIKVLLTSNVSRVGGRVYAANRPVAGALVVLVSERENGDSTRAFQTDSDGSFEFRALPSGRYRIVAIERALDLEYANPAVMRPILETAKRINITAGSTLTERIELPQSKQQP